MRFRNILIFNLIWSVLTVSAYYSVTINPTTFWPSELFALLIPAFILGHIPLLLFWAVKYRPALFISVFTLLFGYRFIVATFAPHFYATDQGAQLKVLTYNVRTFNGFVSSKKLNVAESDAMINWVSQWPGDVICLQEFYSYPTSKVFNTVQRLKRSGFKYHYFSIMRTFKWGSSVGMAIFSKHPIVDKGVLYKKEKSNNQIIWVDIEVNKRPIRIYNAHFQSIFLKEEEFPGYESSEEAQRDIISIVNKLKKAYLKRSKQVQIMLEHLGQVKDPAIVCTDLNDTPYSNAYLRLRDAANNSFERAGWGFGYTYNGFLPTLRIDNQFYKGNLDALKHTVYSSVRYSDHFPVEVAYRFTDAD